MENENLAGTPAPPPPPPAAQPEQRVSAIGRIFGIFFEPTATFEDIARAPGFIAPLILVILCSLGTAAVITQRVDMRDFMMKQLEKSPRAEQMSAAQKEAAVDQMTKFSKYFAFAPPIFVPLIVLIIAGVLMLMVNFVFGGRATFNQLFAVAAHAQVIGVVNAIIIVAIVFLKDPSDFDLQNPVASNLAFLVSQESSKFLHRLLQSIDLFSLWQVFLLGTGAAVCAKMSRGKGIAAVAIPWLILALVSAGFAAAFG